MKKLLAIVWLFGPLASCTAGKDYQRALGSWLNFDIITTGKDYQRILDSWIGYDIEALVKRWGYPTNVLEIPNGNTIYAFNRMDERKGILVKNAVPPITVKYARVTLAFVRIRSSAVVDSCQTIRN